MHLVIRRLAKSLVSYADPVARPDIPTPDQRLRVFISSTLGELGHERVAARASVEQLRMTPVMFELGARSHPPRALYRAYLEQSDVFVGIYWQRYGWTAPDMDISGLEDEYILSEGMPRLVYVKRPAPEMEPRLSEMLDRLRDADTTSYRSFRDADELRDLLVDDLAVLLTERFAGGRSEPAVETLARQNLPAQTTTFLGRAEQIADLQLLLTTEDARLVTLTGAGGTGKTRLAIQVASEHFANFPGGVFFVDLSAEREAGEAFAAVARAVGVAVPTDVDPLDALKAALRRRRALVVLDNFEQVMSAAVGVAELLEECPEVHVLATSREALRVRSEHIFPVPPLSLPDATDPLTAGDGEAVLLFCARAAAVQPGFQLGDHNRSAVIAICRRLDGLPLAIELAAARVRLFGVSDLLDRLQSRLDVLRGGPRDLPKRQQTLDGAIAWSYDLLTPDERMVFDAFAVFSDARLSDVEDTTRDAPGLAGIDMIESMGSLVDKSLVRSQQGFDGRPRFSMLETIREYATHRLQARPEFASAVRRAHAAHYTRVAAGLHQQLTYARRPDVMALLSDELGNMRAAWAEWASLEEVERLTELLAPLWAYYDARGDYRSAIELGNSLLENLSRTPDSAERRRDEFVVRMNVVRTELAVRGFTADAERLIRQALVRGDDAGDNRQRFPGLRSLAYLHFMRSDFARTDELARELMSIARAEQDPALLAEAHVLAGMSSGWHDDLPAALTHLAQAVDQFEATRSGNVDFRIGPNVGVVANVVAGLMLWMSGSPDAASATLQRALDLAIELEHPYSRAYALHHAGLLDLWRQDFDAVADRAEALLAIAERHDYPTWRALALIFRGRAMVGSGSVEPGLVQMDEGFELYAELSAPPVFWPLLLIIRARALISAGRAPEALRYVIEAEEAVQSGSPTEVEVGLAHADLRLAMSPHDIEGAAEMFDRTVELAKARGARTAQLVALTKLAFLRRGTPREDEARSELQDLYSRFTEGSDLPHLAAARAALGLPRQRP